MGPLSGVKIVEMAGIGPGPLCAMLLVLKETCAGVGDVHAFAMFLIFSYAFLLRVPSEALPIKFGRDGDCVISVETGKNVLVLAHR